ncbi:MAG TPA: TatD family hydrolase [Caldisericia bacterium]|nr:TatD family hydrolase [Caldisericia bacterium]
MDNFFVDSHTHLDMPDFNKDREEVIKRALSSNIKYFLNVGYDYRSSINSNNLTKNYNYFFGAVGFHPHDAKSFKNEYLFEFERIIKNNKKIVAVGEIGLDYYRNLSPKETQIEVFKKQIEFAIEMSIPIIIHERDAFFDSINIMKQYRGKIKGVFHCFNRDFISFKEIFNLNFYIGVGGVITYPKNNNLRESFKKIPLDRIILETDAPYLPPQNKRGERNEPQFLIYTAQFLAKIYNISLDYLAKKTTENFSNLFNIKI